MTGNDMSAKSQRLSDSIESDEFLTDPEEPQTEVQPEDVQLPANLTNANVARRRLEEYWEQKALQEELKHIDWEDED